MDLPPDDTPLAKRARRLCPDHLSGNHVECHMLATALRRADADSKWLRKLLGHAARGQIDLERLQDWHDALEAELERRGGDPDSPLDVSLAVPIGEVSASTTNPLEKRCGDCEVAA